MLQRPHKLFLLLLVIIYVPAVNAQDYTRFIGGGNNISVDSSSLIVSDTSGITGDADSLNYLPAGLQNLLETIVDETVEQSEEDISLEIDGIIVDQTRTKAGQDFYDQFFRNWEAPEEARDYSITIKEIPYRLRTTQIVISINDNEVFRSMLQPRNDYIKSLAEYGIMRCEQFLINYDEIMQQLGGEDQLGTGIY